jgi:hypothetical protein
MAGLMGFPARRYRANQSHDESYSSDSDNFGRDARDPRRMFADYQRQAYLRMLQEQQSSPMGMGGFHSPFLNRGRPTPMMGGHTQFGAPSPRGMGMGGENMRNMGIGMGIGAGMGHGMGMGPGMGLGMGLGMGRGGHLGYPSRSPFLGGSPMRYRQPSPFDPGHSHRSHPMFANRHHQHGQSSWSQYRRSPFTTSFHGHDDDDDDESDYDMSSTYNYPRRRRGGLGHFGRSPYQSRHRPAWMYSHNDRYEGYDDDDEDDDDDESDYEEYYPTRRRRRPRC